MTDASANPAWAVNRALRAFGISPVWRHSPPPEPTKLGIPLRDGTGKKKRTGQSAHAATAVHHGTVSTSLTHQPPHGEVAEGKGGADKARPHCGEAQAPAGGRRTGSWGGGQIVKRGSLYTHGIIIQSEPCALFLRPLSLQAPKSCPIWDIRPPNQNLPCI